MPKPSPRQTEILQGLADGLARPDIARNLKIGEETLKTHVSRACLALHAKTSGHAIAIALRRGYIN